MGGGLLLFLLVKPEGEEELLCVGEDDGANKNRLTLSKKPSMQLAS